MPVGSRLMIFQDRKDAGKQLAKKLAAFKDQKDTILLGLPRGGVIVADEVAQSLNLPLDLVVPRKIGAPMNEELALGAIAEDGEGVFDDWLIQALGVTPEYIQRTVAKEKQEAARRLQLYRGHRPPLSLKDKTVILVDDGIATGATMRAAIKSAKTMGAQRVIAAAPVIAPDTLAKIKSEADLIIYLDAPAFFGAVGAFYRQFEQTTDQEVIEIMNRYS